MILAVSAIFLIVCNSYSKIQCTQDPYTFEPESSSLYCYCVYSVPGSISYVTVYTANQCCLTYRTKFRHSYQEEISGKYVFPILLSLDPLVSIPAVSAMFPSLITTLQCHGKSVFIEFLAKFQYSCQQRIYTQSVLFSFDSCCVYSVAGPISYITVNTANQYLLNLPISEFLQCLQCSRLHQLYFSVHSKLMFIELTLPNSGVTWEVHFSFTSELEPSSFDSCCVCNVPGLIVHSKSVFIERTLPNPKIRNNKKPGKFIFSILLGLNLLASIPTVSVMFQASSVTLQCTQQVSIY